MAWSIRSPPYTMGGMVEEWVSGELWEEALKHEGLLDKIVGKYAQQTSCTFEELKSYGWEGLLHAVKGYDPARGSRFSTYAAACIRHACAAGVRDSLGVRKGDRAPFFTSLEEAADTLGGDVMQLSERSLIPLTVVEAICELPVNEERVIYYSYIDGLSDELISAMLGVSMDSVERYRRKALATLREVLDGPSDDA